MVSPQAPSEAFFLPGDHGDLHAVLYRPPARARGGVLFFPPFAEEMNRSRRMITLQAREMAAAGFEVLIVDPSGTGDSAGDFGGALWESWLDDMERAWRWLDARTAGNVVAWSLRLGTVLAAETVSRVRPAPGPRHLAWQPVVNGSTFLDQVLRLRIAGGLTSSRTRETTASLRAVLQSGLSLEIAGYEIAPRLAAALDERRLATSLGDSHARFHWFSVAQTAQPGPPPAVQRDIGELRARGHHVEFASVSGDSFWTTIETTVANELLRPTTQGLLALQDSA
ncbi:MAG TPA: hydrolase 2, exosortase A system-associated [Steroidobacteraceae bacterium]|nr:hydrolase 2, exosortase A system-associated [Steroidobacteraceae bacterium]